MLERAGYDAVAEALDESAVASTIPVVVSTANAIVAARAS